MATALMTKVDQQGVKRADGETHRVLPDRRQQSSQQQPKQPSSQAAERLADQKTRFEKLEERERRGAQIRFQKRNQIGKTTVGLEEKYKIVLFLISIVLIFLFFLVPSFC